MSESGPAPLTELLRSVSDGDRAARDELFELVHRRLMELAQQRMSREKGVVTLQPTALVNEAYLRLMGTEREGPFENRRHFLGAASEAMRRILVDRARRHGAARHGGGQKPVTFHEIAVESAEESMDVLALDEALEALEKEEPALGKVVTMRFFMGLTIEQTAEATGLSPATVKRQWTYARAWLLERMGEP